MGDGNESTSATEAELRARVEDLERELEEIRQREEKARALRWWTASRVGRFLVGPSLIASIERVLQRLYAKEIPTPNEGAHVLAGVVKRVVRVGIVGAVFAALPTLATSAFLVWQNRLITDQVELQREQDYRTTKAQLLDVIYRTKREGIWPWGSQEEAPEAPPVARWSAVRALAALERAAGVQLDLPHVNLEGGTSADLSHADLSGANFKRALLSNADLEEVVLRQADLSRASLSDANLARAGLTGAAFLKADLRRANLSYANVTGANLTGANLTGANLTAADLEGVDFKGVHFLDTVLTDAVLRFVDLSGADLTDVKLTGANLERANLTNVFLDSANLNGADLTNADLTSSYLTRTNLTNANLTGANLTGAKWNEQTVWDGAIWDETTNWGDAEPPDNGLSATDR